jgi:hypothetical protein
VEHARYEPTEAFRQLSDPDPATRILGARWVAKQAHAEVHTLTEPWLKNPDTMSRLLPLLDDPDPLIVEQILVAVRMIVTRYRKDDRPVARAIELLGSDPFRVEGGGAERVAEDVAKQVGQFSAVGSEKPAPLLKTRLLVHALSESLHLPQLALCRLTQHPPQVVVPLGGIGDQVGLQAFSIQEIGLRRRAASIDPPLTEFLQVLSFRTCRPMYLLKFTGCCQTVGMAINYFNPRPRNLFVQQVPVMAATSSGK